MCVQLMTLTFVCLCVASCLGNLRNHRTQYRNMDQFTNMLGPQIQEQHICELPTKACRLQVIMRSKTNRNESEKIETGACNCNGDVTCPTNTDDPNKVIRRRLVSTTHRFVLNMLFCGRIVPETLCRPDEEALIVSGPSIIPTAVENYPCRCRNNRPLHLHEARQGEHHLRLHTYKCGYDKATCANSGQHCMMITPEKTSYTCKCRGRTQCHPEAAQTDSWGQTQFPIYGYCKP